MHMSYGHWPPSIHPSGHWFNFDGAMLDISPCATITLPQYCVLEYQDLLVSYKNLPSISIRGYQLVIQYHTEWLSWLQ